MEKIELIASTQNLPSWIQPTYESIEEVFGYVNAEIFRLNTEGYYDYKKKFHPPLSPTEAFEKLLNEPTTMTTYWFREGNLNSTIHMFPKGANVLNVGGSAIEGASFTLNIQRQIMEIYEDNLETISNFYKGIKFKIELDFDFDRISSKRLKKLMNYISELLPEIETNHHSIPIIVIRGSKKYLSKIKDLLNDFEIVRYELERLINQFKTYELNKEEIDFVNEVEYRLERIQFKSPENLLEAEYKMDVININRKEIEYGQSNIFPYDPYNDSKISDYLKKKQAKGIPTKNIPPHLLQERSCFGEKKYITLKAKNYKRLSFTQHNILSGPFRAEEEVYDAVVMNSVLMHYPDQTKNVILANSLYNLKDGGTLAIENFPFYENDEEYAINYKRWLFNQDSYAEFGLTLENVFGCRYFKYDASKNIWRGKRVKIENGEMVEDLG